MSIPSYKNIRIYYPSGHRLEVPCEKWVGYGIKEGAVAILCPGNEAMIGDPRGLYEYEDGTVLYNPWVAYWSHVLPPWASVWMSEHPQWLLTKPIWSGPTASWKTGRA